MTLPEDMALSFIISKDIAGDFVYDDSADIDKFNFHLSKQGLSELPSLSSNLGFYDKSGPCTENFHSSAQNECHSDSLLYADEKLGSEPWRNLYYQDAHKLCGDYLGDSTFQMDAESADCEVLTDVFPQSQGFVPMQEHGRPETPSHNEIGDQVLLEALEQELNQAEFKYNEEEELEVSVDQINKLHSPSLKQENPESKSENAND